MFVNTLSQNDVIRLSDNYFTCFFLGGFLRILAYVLSIFEFGIQAS